MKNIRISRPASVMVLASAGLLLAACGSNADSAGHDMATHDMSSMSSSMPSDMASMNSGEAASTGAQAAADENDVMFASMMIPHHQQAVEMADIALAKPGASPFVRSLAEKIKGAQQPEIDLMTAWLNEWGSAPAADAPVEENNGMHEGHGGMPGMMSDKQMRQLESAKGREFDRLWLGMMIEHHIGAINMAESVRATTLNDDVIELADAIASGQRKEVEEMQAELDQ